MTPPQANWSAPNNRFFRPSTYRNNTSPGKCVSGQEAEGAMFQAGQPQVYSQNWKALYPVPPAQQGVFIFLGGTSSSKSFWDDYLAEPSIVPPPTTIVIAPGASGDSGRSPKGP